MHCEGCRRERMLLPGHPLLDCGGWYGATLSGKGIAFCLFLGAPPTVCDVQLIGLLRFFERKDSQGVVVGYGKNCAQLAFPKEGCILRALADGQDKDAFNANYRLLAYNKHEGTTVHSGHYVTFMRSEEMDKFFRVSDQTVRQAKLANNPDSDFVKDQAYMLLYERIN